MIRRRENAGPGKPNRRVLGQDEAASAPAATGEVQAPVARARDATRHAILDVAETLFAENGIAATSLRSILLAAGANLAAGHYHFGSKEILVEEVVRRRAEGLVRARDEQLKQARQIADPRLRIRAILRAFFAPAFLGGGESREIAYRFAQVRSHLSIENSELSKRVFAKHFNVSGGRFIKELISVCPSMSKDDVHWRFHLMLSAINYTILNPSRIQVLTKGACDPTDSDRAIEKLVEVFAVTFEVS